MLKFLLSVVVFVLFLLVLWGLAAIVAVVGSACLLAVPILILFAMAYAFVDEVIFGGK